MSTVVNIFSHTIGRKVIMSLTGLFLILFITIHLVGNLQLIFGTPESFNEYTVTMTTSPLIMAASYVTYISIILHAVFGVVLSLNNRKSRPVQYAQNQASANSSWSSRSMFLLGSVLFIFIILHMGNFWFKFKFGTIELDVNGVKDMYTVVETSFTWWWYVLLYVIGMVGLGYHLAHGFQSAFQSLGINHKAYTPVIKAIGLGYSIIVPALFALIPVYMFITSL